MIQCWYALASGHMQVRTNLDIYILSLSQSSRLRDPYHAARANSHNSWKQFNPVTFRGNLVNVFVSGATGCLVSVITDPLLDHNEPDYIRVWQ